MALLVNDNTPRVQYTASASQTVFAYPFAIFEDADLKVYLTPTGSNADDSSDILVLTTNYTVSGAGTTAGGNVTLVVAATSGDIITISRDIAVERTTDYQNLGDLASSSFNDDFDKTVMMIQQNESQLARTFKVQDTDSDITDFDYPLPVAGAYIRYNATKTGLEAGSLPTTLNGEVTAFDTIAALQGIASATNRDLAQVYGYYARGDGGGGEFYWDSTSTATDNGGTIIKATAITTGRWIRLYSGAISVKWFGAKGDGTTDDTVAIQSAVDAGNIVDISDGTYELLWGYIDLNANQVVTGNGILLGGFQALGDNVSIDGITVTMTTGLASAGKSGIKSADYSNLSMNNVTFDTCNLAITNGKSSYKSIYKLLNSEFKGNMSGDIYAQSITLGNVDNFICTGTTFKNDNLYRIYKISSTGYYSAYTGTADNNSATVMTDASASLPSGELVGSAIENLTDGSYGTVTANTTTTVTVASLTGGSANTWAIGDSYSVADLVDDNYSKRIVFSNNVFTGSIDAVTGNIIFDIYSSSTQFIFTGNVVETANGTSCLLAKTGGGTGPDSYQMRDIIISDNVFNVNVLYNCIDMQGAYGQPFEGTPQNVLVSNNDITMSDNTSSRAINLRTFNRAVVDSNDINYIGTNTTFYGIDVRGGEYTNITGGMMTNAAILIGMQAGDSDIVNASIIGVSLVDHAGRGIDVSGVTSSADINICSNNFKSATQGAVRIKNSTLNNLVVTGNVTSALGYSESTAVIAHVTNASNSWNSAETDGSAAPTGGTWAVGDRVYNTSPTAGGTMGWVCTTAGTPGTWKTFGAITA